MPAIPPLEQRRRLYKYLRKQGFSGIEIHESVTLGSKEFEAAYKAMLYEEAMCETA